MNGAKVAGETGINTRRELPPRAGAGLRHLTGYGRAYPAALIFSPGLVIISLGFDALPKTPSAD